jgi:hypothetical protein
MEKKNMKNPQREIIVICRNLRGYSLILPKMNINLHHTLKATNDKKCPTQQRCKKTKKNRDLLGPRGARARFLTERFHVAHHKP